MLRLPKFEVFSPGTVDEAIEFLGFTDRTARVIAGGTDLLPNLKHRIVDVDVLVSLDRLHELRGVAVEADGTLVIGAMTSLDEVATHPEVLARAPALAIAAGCVSGPQLRRMGTLGGNVMLDTRCRYINQTHFWRKALGYCLKKDGSVCHVVQGGSRCVAAASNDTAPALITLGASVCIAGPKGPRTVPVEELYLGDGVKNTKVVQGELVTEIRVPPQRAGHRGGYVKLRSREAIDFPLLGVAARVDLDGRTIVDADVALVALQARPMRLKGVADGLRGLVEGSDGLGRALDELAAKAAKQCRPMPNIPGDHEYRQRMVPVFVKRAVVAALASGTLGAESLEVARAND